MTVLPPRRKLQCRTERDACLPGKAFRWFGSIGTRHSVRAQETGGTPVLRSQVGRSLPCAVPAPGLNFRKAFGWGEHPIARASVPWLSWCDDKWKILPKWKFSRCSGHFRPRQSIFSQGQFGIRAHTKSIRGCLQPRSPIIAEHKPCGCQTAAGVIPTNRAQWGKHPIAPARFFRLSSQDLMPSTDQDKHVTVTLVVQRDQNFRRTILDSMVAPITVPNHSRAPAALKI